MTEREMPTFGESLREYGRGLAGGLLFSLPLLYTMEVWWAGFVASPARILLYVAAVFVLLLGYNRYAGLREDASWVEVFIDSVEELGLGIVTSTGVLFLIGRIGPGDPPYETLGKVLIEAGLVAIGFSVGTAQLGGGSEDEPEEDRESSGRASGKRVDGAPAGIVGQVVIAGCGAVLFAANVAPTEEIVVIAIGTSSLRIAMLAIVSMLLATLVLYFSEFVRAPRSGSRSLFDVVAGTVITYAVALIASAAILAFAGRFTGVAAELAVKQTIVLGFPAVLGASAGRLLIHR